MENLIASVSSLRVDVPVIATLESLSESGVRNIILKDYQLFGVNWLLKCKNQSHGGLLCDEMGLGKTCQTIAFLATILHRNPKVKILIVSPLSVLSNWIDEFTKCLPGVEVFPYVGDKEARKVLRSKFTSVFHILITTYELCLSDEAFLSEHHWDVLVVDEGHRLKNAESLLFNMLCDTCRGFRFILTGTPVQNNLAELFNLLHFVAPKLFPLNMCSKFVHYFSDSTSIQKMGTLLKPFLLRRSKQQVLPGLPVRRDVVIYHGLSSLQTKLYRALLTKNAELFTSTISNSLTEKVSRNRLSNLLIQLRKCVDHPYLFDGVEPEPFELGEHLVYTSHKLLLLDKLLTFLYDPSDKTTNDTSTSSLRTKPVHKVLIFSQMTRMLDILQDYMTLRNYTYERLDGSVRGADRFNSTKVFNRDQETFVFLLSTKAGGQGLNLIAADTVILVDSDFNPQNDIQAAGRCHRIGQTKPVRIIRLVGRNTIEESILSRAEMKLKLTSSVLGSTETNVGQETEQSDLPKIDELHNVLKFGLGQLLQSTTVPDDTNALSESDSKPLNPDFTAILGETDLQSGHWLEPPSISQTLNNQMDWVLLTDEPYRCETSEADQKAAEALIEAYEASVTETGQIETSQSYQTRLKSADLASQDGSKATNVQQLSEEELAERREKIKNARLAQQRKREEDAQKRAASKLAKQQALWKSAGYETLSVFRPQNQATTSTSDQLVNPTNNCWPEISNDFDADNLVESFDTPVQHPGIYYRYGDASLPLTQFSKSQSAISDIEGAQPYLVCLTVDCSGIWGLGGFFGAIDSQSTRPKEAYELAGKMHDLMMGDCHLVPVWDSQLVIDEIKTLQDFMDKCKTDKDEILKCNFCGLLVAQKHSKRSQSIGSPPDLHLDSLEQSLVSLGQACTLLGRCSVHIPRLGHGTHAFTWYKVERLLRKHLVERNSLQVYVYYYRSPVNSTQNTQQSSSSLQSSTVFSGRKRKLSDVVNNEHSNITHPIRSTKHLVNLFTGKVFHLLQNQTTSDEILRQKRDLQRLIIAYDGDISRDCGPRVTHMVSLSGSVTKSLPDFDCTHVISPKWIYDCVKQNRLLSESEYLL